MKSLSIKGSAQIRIARKQLPNIYLTFSRRPQHRGSCPPTRIRKFFQIHSFQRSPYSTCTYLQNGRTSTDNPHDAFGSHNLHFTHFPYVSSLRNLARIFLPVKHPFSHSELGRNKFHPFRKISANGFSSLDLVMRLHS